MVVVRMVAVIVEGRAEEDVEVQVAPVVEVVAAVVAGLAADPLAVAAVRVIATR